MKLTWNGGNMTKTRLAWYNLSWLLYPSGGSICIRFDTLEAYPCVQIIGFGNPVEPDVWNTTKGSFQACPKVLLNGKKGYLVVVKCSTLGTSSICIVCSARMAVVGGGRGVGAKMTLQSKISKRLTWAAILFLGDVNRIFIIQQSIPILKVSTLPYSQLWRHLVLTHYSADH